MKSFLCFTAFLLCCPLAAAQAHSDSGYPVRVEQVKFPQGIRFIAFNDGPAIVTVSFQLEGKNILSDKELPLATAI
ncbi:MAG: hypothetical protein LBR95_08710, partial [Azoarcus sp.]|nr:hypothetical protein [Azoarcus sp.]